MIKGHSCQQLLHSQSYFIFVLMGREPRGQWETTTSNFNFNPYGCYRNVKTCKHHSYMSVLEMRLNAVYLFYPDVLRMYSNIHMFFTNLCRWPANLSHCELCHRSVFSTPWHHRAHFVTVERFKSKIKYVTAKSNFKFFNFFLLLYRFNLHILLHIYKTSYTWHMKHHKN